MKLRNITKAFTLIELLVVITIIGILATGATSVYTSQIQKARDATRINDVSALTSGIEQYYQDVSEYPDGDNFGSGGVDSLWNNVSGVQTYVPSLPSDPKHGQNCNSWGAATAPYCAYMYVGADDINGITLGAYEISSAFENTWNVTWKAAKDDGNDNVRLELGLDLAANDTSCDTTPPGTTAGGDGDALINIDKGAYTGGCS